LRLNRKELFDKKHIKILKSDDIDMKIRISEKSLNDYVNAKSKKIKVKRPKVRLRNGRIYLSGTFSWKIGRISFDDSGSFRVRNNKIYFHPSRFRLNRINLPGYLIKRSLRAMNPILDMRKFPFKTQLKYIKIMKNELIISSFEDGM